MPSALLHPFVAACMAFAPAAPTSEPVPVAEPTADAAAPETDTPDAQEPDTDAVESSEPDAPAGDDATPTEDETGTEAAPPASADSPAAEPDPAPEASQAEPSEVPAERVRPETASAPPPRANRNEPPPNGRRDDIVGKALLGGGLGSLGLGLGLAGVSAWFWVERGQADRNVDRLDPGAEQNEARDQRKQYGTLATATTIAGSVYVVTGVALLLLHARDRKRVSATPTVGAVNGVVVQGRF